MNRASGSSREVLTPIRRWMSVPVAIASKPRDHRRAAAGEALDLGRRPGAAGGAAAARTSSATASAAPGRPSDAGRGRHRGVRRRVLEEAGRVEQRRGIEGLVVDEPRRAGLDEARRVGPLVAGRVRIRHDDHRQAERGHLGQGRRAGPADDEVRRGQRGQHLVAQERVRPVAAADVGRQGLAAGQRRRVAVVAGDVDDRDPLDEARQRLGDRGVEAPDGLRAAEDEQDPLARRDVQPRPGRHAVDRGDVADRRAGHEARPVRGGAGQRPAGRLERDRERGGQPGGRPDRPARDDVAVPQHDRDAERRRRHQDRDRHVAAGREDRGRSLARPGSRPPAGRTAPRRIGSRTAWTSASVVRSERAARRRSGMPAAGTRVASRPRWPPSQRSSGASGLARSDRATARAG